MDCLVFEYQYADKYDQIFVHHQFAEGKLFPKKVINPTPPDLTGLKNDDGTLPLVFNRTETNQQYINLTLSAKIDAINILKNEMYHRPVKGNDSAVFIKN